MQVVAVRGSFTGPLDSRCSTNQPAIPQVSYGSLGDPCPSSAPLDECSPFSRLIVVRGMARAMYAGGVWRRVFLDREPAVIDAVRKEAAEARSGCLLDKDVSVIGIAPTAVKVTEIRLVRKN